jgi:hypothetical protein
MLSRQKVNAPHASAKFLLQLFVRLTLLLADVAMGELVLIEGLPTELSS